jgi:hypothetical protein
MSEELYKAKKGIKEIYIAPHGDHCKSLRMNREEYTNRLYGFVDRVMTK